MKYVEIITKYEKSGKIKKEIVMTVIKIILPNLTLTDEFLGELIDNMISAKLLKSELLKHPSEFYYILFKKKLKFQDGLLPLKKIEKFIKSEMERFLSKQAANL